MSEDGSQDVSSVGNAAAAAAEITSILEQIRMKKAEFDAATTSASSLISQETQTTQTEIASILEQIRTKKAEFDTAAVSASDLISQEAQTTQAAASQIADLQSAVTSSKAAIDGDRAAIAELVERAKVSQKEIDGIKTDVATIKGAADSAQQSVIGDQAAVSQSKTDVEALKAAAAALGEKLSADHADVAARIAGLQAQQETFQSLLKDLSDAKAQAESDNTAIKNSLSDVDRSKEKFSSLKSETEMQFAALLEKQQALEGKISEIDDASSKITTLRKRLLESSDDAKSVQDEIDDLRSQISTALSGIAEERDAATAALVALREQADTENRNFSTATSTRFDELYKKLEITILALLPSAGAAGLSSTYYDAKSRYSPTSYGGKPGRETPKGWRRVLRGSFGNNPASVVATVVFYAMFVLPLAIIAWGSFRLLYRMEAEHFQVDWKMLAVRLLIAAPLISISSFGFASLMRYRKLFEEYNHKQRVMELYQSFVREIGEKGDEEQKKKLLTIMVDSVAEKAWKDSKPKSDNMSEGALSQMEKLLNLAARIKTFEH